LATCNSAAPSASSDAVLSGATGDSSTRGRKRAESAEEDEDDKVDWSTTNETDLLMLAAASREGGMLPEVRSPRDERLDLDARRSPFGSAESAASRLWVRDAPAEVDDDDDDDEEIDDEDGGTAENESGAVGDDG
jgi:hypothetical protein